MCLSATDLLIFNFATFQDVDEHGNLQFRNPASLVLELSRHLSFQIISRIVQPAMSESFNSNQTGMLGEGEMPNDIGSILSALEQNMEALKLSDAGTVIE
jgi:hypothetical protein